MPMLRDWFHHQCPNQAPGGSGDLAAVEFKNVTFAYGATPTLENVSFSLSGNGVNYVIGPNGGGKTTLLKLMLGELQPDSGEILIFGKPSVKMKGLIGYAPQSISYDASFPVSVFEVVLMGRLGLRWGGRYSRSDKDVARRVLDEVDLWDVRDKLFAELSGGLQRRALIARALASEPKALALDEPTANIDSASEQKLLELVNRVQSRMAIILVSHDLSFVPSSIRQVLCVDRGVRVHPTDEITDDGIRIIFGSEMRMIRHDLDCN